MGGFAVIVFTFVAAFLSTILAIRGIEIYGFIYPPSVIILKLSLIMYKTTGN